MSVFRVKWVLLFCSITHLYSNDLFYESNEVSVAKIFFYDLGKKVFIPSFVAPMNFKYIDIYCGCSFGYNIWFVNKGEFKFGILSGRLDLLNALVDWITFYKNCDVAKFRTATNINDTHKCGEAFGLALLDNLICCVVNMKFGPFVVHFGEFNVLTFSELAGCIGAGHEVRQGDEYDNYKRRLRNYCIFNVLMPSLQIDALYIANHFKKKFKFSLS